MCKSWIYDNKKTLYELKRVQVLLKMIIDQILARPNIGYLKIDFLKKLSLGKCLTSQQTV